MIQLEDRPSPSFAPVVDAAADGAVNDGATTPSALADAVPENKPTNNALTGLIG